MFFFVSGHVPPLLRNVEDLFLDKESRAYSASSSHSRALARYSSALSVTAVAPVSTLLHGEVTAEESFDLHQPTSAITNLAAATVPSAKLNEKRTSLKIVMSWGRLYGALGSGVLPLRTPMRSLATAAAVHVHSNSTKICFSSSFLDRETQSMASSAYCRN